jgi:hypothetical protein
MNKKNAGSSMLQKSQAERREDQDNSNIYDQPFPKVVPEEKDIHTYYDGH